MLFKNYMQILIPDSWLREYLETNATPKDIQKCLSLCGPSIERSTSVGNDTVYDIEVTTNRPDCMSVIGIAREAAAILPHFNFTAKLKSDPLLNYSPITTSPKVEYLKVKVDPALCLRFTAVLIKNVSVKNSPPVIFEKLQKVGMRGINNVIDVTNLLMHEYGQPIHVFDYDRIGKHTMHLRQSQPGETLTTLDGQSHKLPGGDIVIADGSGTLIDLCGIMGGLNSSVTPETKNVLLFVQTYAGSKIRTTSMNLAHRTSAAVLFEKNLPTQQVIPTLSRSIQLIEELSGGQTENSILDILSVQESEKIIKLDTPLSRLSEKIIGVNLNSKQISDILKSLNFKLLSENQIQIPYYRQYDIDIPEDLVEEIARIYGYHNIPPRLMSGSLPDPSYDKTFYWENRIKTALKYFGFTEIYSYSLVDKDLGLKLKNPLSSEWTYLRTSLFPSHQNIIETNLGRVGELNLFEIANVYLPKEHKLPEEQSRLIISSTNPDYLKLKGIIQSLLSDIGFPDLPINISSSQNILYWEIPMLDLLAKTTELKPYVPISKFTPVVEDINVIHKEKYETIVKQIRSASSLIKNIELIDKYSDKLTLRLTFHSNEKQLSAEDIAPLRLQIQANLSNLH